MPRLILASASPRRRELLAALKLSFEVVPAVLDETLPAGVPVEDAVVALAYQKGRAVAERVPDALVVAADTLVLLGGEPLGKPADADEARAMLLRLRGRSHTVVTGVALLTKSAHEQALVSTLVTMREYTDAEIEATIGAGTPFDKAGGYGIQDPVFDPVARIEGCCCNVMGLPLWTVRAMLLRADAGLDPAAPDLERPVCRSCPLRPAAQEVVRRERQLHRRGRGGGTPAARGDGGGCDHGEPERTV